MYNTLRFFSPYLINLNPLSKQLSLCRYVSVLCLSRAAVPAVWLSSLCAPSNDKIAALSQAIAHEAKGHLRNDRASMTD